MLNAPPVVTQQSKPFDLAPDAPFGDSSTIADVATIDVSLNQHSTVKSPVPGLTTELVAANQFPLPPKFMLLYVLEAKGIVSLELTVPVLEIETAFPPTSVGVFVAALIKKVPVVAKDPDGIFKKGLALTPI
jgi:hypothetical protein